MGTGLLLDLYELTMASSYLRRAMTAPATFSLFVRRLPPERGFLVAAGLEDVLGFLEEFHFDDEELSYLASQGFGDDELVAFAPLRFTGDVWAVPEGRVVFADEPLLEVTAPLPEAQLVETVLLNKISFNTAVASKAARCVIAAQGRFELVEFAIDVDAQRLKNARRRMFVTRAAAGWPAPRIAAARHSGNHLGEFQRALERLGLPVRDDGARDARCERFFAEFAEDANQLGFRCTVDDIGCAHAFILAHPHVEGPVLHEAEAAGGFVELRRGNAQVEQNAVEFEAGRDLIGARCQ